MNKIIAALVFVPAIAAAQGSISEARSCMSPQMRTHYLEVSEWIETKQASGASERQALKAARERYSGRELSAVQQGIAAVYGPYGYGPSMIAHAMQLACYQHVRN